MFNNSFLAIFEMEKKWNLVKKNFLREIDLFDFMSFFGLDFFKFSGPLCSYKVFFSPYHSLYLPCLHVLWRYTIPRQARQLHLVNQCYSSAGKLINANDTVAEWYFGK